MADIKLNIEPELQAYLPPLDRETKAALEDSIKSAGRATQPIEVWKGKNVIIDGHNRYEICTRLGLPFEIDEVEFSNMNEAKRRMLEVQLSRRNLTKEGASKFRGLYLKSLRGARAKAVANGSAEPTGKTVAQQAAEDTGVSEATIKRDAQFTDGVEKLAEVDAAEAKKVEEGKSKINKGTISKIATAKTEAAREKAINTALQEAKRENRKAPVNPRPKPKVNPDPTPSPAPEQAPEDHQRLVERFCLFLQAKNIAGRRSMMKQMVEIVNKIEGTEYTVPEEYTVEDKAKAGPGKAKPVGKAPPPVKAKRRASDD